MAYTDYSGYGDESDLETLRRRAKLASMFMGGLSPDQGLTDLAGQYLGNRLQEAGSNITNAVNVVSDPYTEMQRRMAGIQQQPTTLVAGPAQPVQPTQGLTAQSITPGNLISEEERQRRLQELARQAGAPTQTPAQVPSQQPTPTVSRAQQAQQQIQGQPPTQIQQVEQQPQWAKDLIASQGDMTKLHAFIGNENNPEEGRKWASGLLQKMFKDQVDRDDANALINRYVTGDPSAINTVTKELRKRTQEGSYFKAYLLNRLGFTELAREEQYKLGAGGKVGQASVDGKQFTVEYDAQGAPIRAWNVRGTEVGEDTLAKISAGGLRPGAQIFGFTGEVGIVKDPITGQDVEVRQRTNSQTGQVENVIVTGPNAGKLYTGAAIPQAKSVSTAMAKMDYQTITALQQRHGGNVLDALKEFQTIKGPLNDIERNQFLQLYGYGTTVPGGAMPGMPQGAQPVYRPGVEPQQVQQIPQPSPQVTTQQVQGAPIQQPQSPQAAVVPQQAQVTPQPQAIRPAPAVPGVGRPAGGLTTPVGQLQVQQSLGKTAGEAQIGVAKERSQSYNEYLDKELAPQAENGNTVVSVRKQQFAIFDRPGIDANKIFGLYNASQESPGDQKLSIIRDIFGGVFKPEAEVSQRLALLNLTPSEKSALQEFNIANQKINVATLKQTAGAGSVSDAEQKANRESNVDPTKIPALGAYNAMAQSQFDGDRARWKADWAIKQPATNRIELDAAWRKESQRLSKIYEDMARERIKFINQNGNTYNAVREGYRRFPVPEYDPDTNTWKKTKPLGAILGQ